MQKRLKKAIFAAPQISAEAITPADKLQQLRREMPQAGYIRQAGLLAIIPISSATLWRWVKAESFPNPIKLGARVTAWRIDAVTNWLSKNQ